MTAPANAATPAIALAATAVRVALEAAGEGDQMPDPVIRVAEAGDLLLVLVVDAIAQAQASRRSMPDDAVRADRDDFFAAAAHMAGQSLRRTVEEAKAAGTDPVAAVRHVERGLRLMVAAVVEAALDDLGTADG